MANYTYNSDKRTCLDDYGLYNYVVSTVLGDGDEPATLQELKDWGKIEQDADDDLITELGIAAREVLEDFTGIGFINRTVVAVINNANGSFRLPYGPVTVDPTGVDDYDQEIDLNYRLGAIETLGKFQVSYTGGYTTLPKRFKTALKEQFLFMYENRGESDIGLSPMAQMLLAPVRQVL